MATQQDKNIKKATGHEAGRTTLVTLIIILFFLFLAWATWCFFEWKIKTVEKYPLSAAIHSICPAGL